MRIPDYIIDHPAKWKDDKFLPPLMFQSSYLQLRILGTKFRLLSPLISKRSRVQRAPAYCRTGTGSLTSNDFPRLLLMFSLCA